MVRSRAAERVVNAANKLSSEDLFQIALAELKAEGLEHALVERGVRFTTKKGRSFVLDRSILTSEVDGVVKKQVLDLLQSNMKEMYGRSHFINWNDDEKISDLTHADARILLAWTDDNASIPASTQQSSQRQRPSQSEPTALAGYLLFRFDTEETDPDDPCVRRGQDTLEVSYLYELQIAPHAQGAGLGHVLTSILERMSRGAHMRKVMLTCFAFNKPARAFYEAEGYELDMVSARSSWELDRRECDSPVPDYRIMSKDLLHS